MIVRRLVHWLACSLAFLAVARFVPGFQVADLNTALVASVIYGLATSLGSILLLPLAYTVFLLVPRSLWSLMCLATLNAAVLYALGRWMPGIQVVSYQAAILAVLALTVCTWAFELVLGWVTGSSS